MKDTSGIFSGFNRRRTHKQKPPLQKRSAAIFFKLCLIVAGLSVSNSSFAEFDFPLPGAGTIQFSAATYQANESDGQAIITLTRTGGSTGGLTVDIFVGSNTGDTATSPEDYTVTQPTEISWGDGDAADKTFTINLVADAQTEGDETLSLDVQPSPISLEINNQVTGVGTPTQATLTIQDSTSNPLAVNQFKIISGNFQRGVAGDTLTAFVVNAVNAAGAPVVGATVNWEVRSNTDGNLQQLTTTTDNNGQSSNTLTLLSANRMIVRATLGAPIGQDGLVAAVAISPAQVTFIVNGSVADSPGLTKNQKSTAKAIDSACTALVALGAGRTAEQDDLLATCTNLGNATPAVVAASLSMLAHEEVTAQSRIILETAKLQSASIHRRLSNLRMGSRGLSLAGLKINIDGQALPSSLIASLFGNQAKGGSAGEESSAIASRWGTFINTSLVVGDKGSTGQESGFNFRSRGFTAGADYRLSDKLVLGSALGYASKSSDFKGSEGELEIDNWHLSAYGSYFTSQSFYLDGLIRLGRNNIDTQRQINLSGSPLQMGLGDTTGWEYAASLSGGYEFSQNALTLSPYGRLGYIQSSINSYAESASNPGGAGAGSVLSIDSQKVDSITTVLGGQLTYAISTRSNVYLLQLNGEWEHEFRDNSRAIAAQFVYDPTRTSFDIDSNSPDRNYFNLGMGVSAVFANGRSGYLRYESRLGQDDVRQYWINAGIRLEL